MATYTKELPGELTNYSPQPIPALPDSLKIWILNEFKRLQTVIAAQDDAIAKLKAAVEELRAQNP